MCCVISYFYIEPQLFTGGLKSAAGCVISYFYIEPQLQLPYYISVWGCVISYFYIEPQPISCSLIFLIVVLYLTSTSNHNLERRHFKNKQLCYILLLHRTTTKVLYPTSAILLCYILLLHRTTTSAVVSFALASCVISYFYIEPQPIWDNPLRWKPLRDSLVYRKWCWCVTFYGQKY